MEAPQKLKIGLPYNLAIPLMGLYLKKNENSNLKRYIHPLFIALLLLLFRATPRLGIESAVGLYYSHSNVGSKLHLWPTPQLMAMPNP